MWHVHVFESMVTTGHNPVISKKRLPSLESRGAVLIAISRIVVWRRHLFRALFKKIHRVPVPWAVDDLKRSLHVSGVGKIPSDAGEKLDDVLLIKKVDV